VRAIAEAHGGRVDVRSEAGAGATFTISVPLDADGRSSA
jgi:signal transduction histidine kinase